MSEHHLTIPRAAHRLLLTTPDAVHVVIADAENPTRKVTVDPSTMTVDPETQALTIMLANGDSLTLHGEDPV